MKPLSVDTPQALAFLKTTLTRGAFGNLTAIDPQDGRCYGVGFSPDTLHRAEVFIKRHAGRNLYWTVNALGREVNGKPRKSEITAGRYAHLDLDDPSPEALKRLKGAAPPPTFIIFSGGGYGAFWKLKQTARSSPDALAQLETLNKHLIGLFGAGAGTWNVDRLMRLPWTVNHLSAKKRAQGRKPAATRLIEHHPERTYTLAQLRKMVLAPLTPGPVATTDTSKRHSQKTTGSVSESTEFAAHIKTKPLTQLEYLYARRARAAALAAPQESDKSRSGNLWSIVGYYISMGWSDEYIHTHCAEHPHVLSQKNPERAIQRCIDGQRRKREEARQAQTERARQTKNQRPRY